jgi:hypothetical protein
VSACVCVNAIKLGSCVSVHPSHPTSLRFTPRFTRTAQERLPWAEEVLVSKAELDERRARVAELEQQVGLVRFGLAWIAGLSGFVWSCLVLSGSGIRCCVVEWQSSVRLCT